MDSISRRSFIGIMCTAGALFLTSCGSQKKDVQNAVNYTAESASGGNEQIANLSDAGIASNDVVPLINSIG